LLELIFALRAAVRSSFKGQRELALENLALRQQLAVLELEEPCNGWAPEERPVSRFMPRHRRRAGLHSKPYCERVIGFIRRECLNHVIVLGERHLHRNRPPNRSKFTHYVRMFAIHATPVLMLNHAVAVAMCDGAPETATAMNPAGVSSPGAPAKVDPSASIDR